MTTSDEPRARLGAPGQPDWQITGHTQLAGVMGWPIEHSVSPPMHNAAFRALGMDWCYLPLAVPPAQVKEALLGVRACGFRGINVTVPHKRAVLSLVDTLTPEAEAIGAVNTVLMRPEALVGHNTDAAGFMRALRDTGLEPEGCRALVLGAGGAARAVVYGLASVGARLTILNRDERRAVALAGEFGALFPRARLAAGVLDRRSVENSSMGVHLVVNATSLGMWPAVDTTPWPEDVAFPPGALLFDLVYNPRETRCMRRARLAGARAVDGLGMLVYQGAEAFSLWTGVVPPADVMLAACVAVLGGR